MNQRLIDREDKPEDGVDSHVRPQNLNEFVGQTKVKKNLRVFIEAARWRAEALDHVLFAGPPGLGKTTLAQIMARELGVNFRATSGPVIAKAGDLAALLTNLEDRDILFIDEIHRLNPAVEEILYPAMEDYQLDLIIGEGPCRAQMEQACRGYGIDQNFRFTGRVPFQDMPPYVNLTDMVLMPSEQEGLSRAYLETQACARVLMASAIPPAREVIDDGETGLLFQRGDINEIAAKTLLVARNPELRQRIGERARKRAEQHNLDSVIRAYSDVLVRTFRSYGSNRGL